MPEGGPHSHRAKTMKKFSLKLWQRVLIVAATSSLPLLVIAAYLINVSVSKDIRFTLLEAEGNAFQRPLEQLLDLLPRYQAAARQALAGDLSAAATRMEIQRQIDQAMTVLAANCQGDLGRKLKYNDNEETPATHGGGHTRLTAVLSAWQKLREAPLAVAAEGEDAGGLVADIRMMIDHAGNASNLILDTELDSFYLVDITLSTLPQTQQRLGGILLQGGDWLRQGRVAAHQQQIAVMAAMLRQTDQDRILTDARTSLKKNEEHHAAGASLQKNLPPAVAQYVAASQVFLGLLDRLNAGQNVSAADFERAGWQARAESFRLWQTAAGELDGLLAARIHNYRRTELWEFASLLATILLTGLAAWLVSVEIDLTDRKETEAKLRQLKNHLANIIDSMPAALVGLDRAGRVTQWNRAAEALTGQPESAAIGQSAHALLPEFAPWIRTLEEKAENGRPASLEKLCLESGGERQIYDLMLYPLVAAGIEGSELRIENVTERHNVQAVIIQSEKMISLGGMAAGMAHEINNPLGIISQAAQNIERRLSPGLPANQKVMAELGLPPDLLQAYLQRREIPVFIQDIREAASRAAKIIASMLQFSRKSGTERQPVSLAAVMNRTVELAGNDYDLRKQFDFRSIEIIREFQPDLPDLPVMEGEIQQVVLNLLKNAAQAMAQNPPGRKPAITLRLRREDKFAVMEVADNGPGMEEKVARRVFEPFFTTKSPGAGTGLGLSVSYMIITQNHQGFISVESKPGNGSRFIIKLPAPGRSPG